MSIFSKIMDAISWKGTRPTQTGQTPKPAPQRTPQTLGLSNHQILSAAKDLPGQQAASGRSFASSG